MVKKGNLNLFSEKYMSFWMFLAAGLPFFEQNEKQK